ncbi:hypothetical protein Y032_0052g2264 [Ancylostoma ceylanicum]|uniref:Phlebovirus glycoprotein G2 fusion domain-containing protein n=1 Tax=Ancylostoma ceylanicum TaxID=53326 RepID=A0A016U989_9BILA|nr:hypothetical protein Y032_0052g2264 [Ancylostoma ceylanicum]
MYTVLTKIEAILNTRPLTKLNTEDITKIPLRPIDFLQGNVKFSIPNATDFDIDDPSYDPEFIQTEQQAMEAVQFAENIATKFWESWRMEYLTSLRDSQRLQLKQPRHLTRKHPEIGEIVIIEQDLTPRGNWPYGKITEIITSKDGLVRSAKILMPNHKVIQRPLNKIYPLEIRSGTNEPPPLEPTQGHESPSHSTTQRQEPHHVETTEEQQLPQNRRNGLQRATKTRARQFFREFAADLENSRSSSNVNISLFTLALLTLVIPNSAQSIKCSNGTVHIKPQSNQYELCIGNECRKIINNTESGKYLLPISPDGSPVMVQIIENKEQTSLNETAFCKRPEFCDHHYLLSKSLLGNPHCWPTGAIATCAIFLYISTLLVLTFLLALRKSVPCHKSKRNTRNQQWHAQRIQNQLSVFELAPIRNNTMCIICTLLSTTNACQHGYTRHSADLVCDQNNLCHYEYSRELLFNSIQSEMCIELVYMNKSIGSIKFYKNPVQFKCTKLVESFTRPTQVQIYSVERCAQAGSCTIGKCQSVGTNETIPELKIAAKYPGYTGCFNGCGGLLCGCFMPQPSCVFYKIAHKPLSKRIFEIVKCLHWTPTIPLDIDMTILGKHKMLSLNITPYVTQKIDKLNITAISLQKSLFAATYSRFAIAENISYILPDEFKVPVECESAMQAQNHFSDCFNRVKCECGNSVQSCQCPEDSIRTLRATNRHTLPIQTPYGTITNERNQILAYSNEEELILHVESRVIKESTALIINQNCTTNVSPVRGCYNCPHGAEVQINCSSRTPAIVTVTCETHTFPIRCAYPSNNNSIIMHFDKAIVHETCALHCAAAPQQFEIKGTLLYHISHTNKSIFVNQVHTVPIHHQWFRDVSIPDLKPLVKTIVTHWKLTVAAMSTVFLLVALSYAAGPIIILYCAKFILGAARLVGHATMVCIRNCVHHAFCTFSTVRRN